MLFRSNEHGELGNGYYNETYVCGSWVYSRERAVRDRGAYNPVQVSNLSNIVSIAAGRDYAVALDASGNVYYWGNSAGYFYSAANVAGGVPYNDRLNFLDHSGTVTATEWWSSYSGSYGSDSTSHQGSRQFFGFNYMRTGDGIRRNNPLDFDNNMYATTPVMVLGPGGTDHLSDPTGQSATVLGSNDVVGAQALKATANRTARAVKLAAGAMSVSVLLADGTVYAWGLNDKGQLGDGTGLNRVYPTQVASGEQKNGTRYLQDIVDLVAGNDYVLAMDSHGNLFGWGDNTDKQLVDDEDIASVNAPIKLAYGNDVQIAQLVAGDRKSVV